MVQKFSNGSERFITTKLLQEGKDVTVLATRASKNLTGRTADFVVDGVLTETKEISDLTTPDLSKGIKRRIESGLSQSSNLIIDIRNQEGATQDVVELALSRIFGNNKDKDITMRVIGDGFDLKKGSKASA